MRRVEQQLSCPTGTGREVKFAVADGGDKNLREAGEGAAFGADADVEAGPHEEDGAGEAHEQRRHGEPQRPVDAALEVDDDGGRQHHGDGKGEVVPVEEAGDAPPPVGSPRVKLVSAERQVTWPDPAGADDQEEEGRHERGELGARGAMA